MSDQLIVTCVRWRGIVFMIAVVLAACTGDAGPLGPIGPTGPAGEPGAPGVVRQRAVTGIAPQNGHLTLPLPPEITTTYPPAVTCYVASNASGPWALYADGGILAPVRYGQQCLVDGRAGAWVVEGIGLIPGWHFLVVVTW